MSRLIRICLTLTMVLALGEGASPPQAQPGVSGLEWVAWRSLFSLADTDGPPEALASSLATALGLDAASAQSLAVAGRDYLRQLDDIDSFARRTLASRWGRPAPPAGLQRGDPSRPKPFIAPAGLPSTLELAKASGVYDRVLADRQRAVESLRARLNAELGGSVASTVVNFIKGRVEPGIQTIGTAAPQYRPPLTRSGGQLFRGGGRP